MKKLNEKHDKKIKLILAFSFVVFILLSVSYGLIVSFYLFINAVPFLDIKRLPPHSEGYFLVLISFVMGIFASLLFRKIILKPLFETYDALDSIAEGDYSVRIEPKGIRAIRHLGKRINTMATELDSIETMRNDFVNNFSHEFKTPIISIAGFAKILKKGILSPDEQEEYLDIIISESQRLSELSANILGLTRLENQTILSHKSEFNVSEQIRLVFVLLANKWQEKNIEISFEGEDYIITANKDLLQQLWTNIIDNAFKYSPENSQVTVTVGKKEENLIFTVSDQGEGMNEETARHAFDKFYQGDLAHKSKGNGIGLAVAKKICELHGGSIKIKSTGKDGTVFEVILPVKN